MELDAVADELYGLSLDDFILTRNVLEKQAKGANDKVLAAEIHRLPKPNAIAWLINQLVRQHNDEIQTLLALGSSIAKRPLRFPATVSASYHASNTQSYVGSYSKPKS